MKSSAMMLYRQAPPVAAGKTTRRRSALFLGIAAGVAVMSPAVAQPTGSGLELEEIVVTATRREESAQGVAVAISALSGVQLEELKLFNFEDMAVAIPGLSMTNTGREPGVIAVRGVGYAPNSSAPPAVDIYINELPINSVYAFNSIFDIEQMELLRGPQGTLRGRPSPAGAVLLTTRRPDVFEMGGTVSGSFSDADAQNYQGALNVPIVKDKLALRIAGVKNSNEGPGGKTFDGDKPSVDDDGLRATLLYQATDDLSFLLTHHYMKHDVERFTLVQGPGAGYNGPAIKSGDRRSAVEQVGTEEVDIGITSLQATWDIGEHRLVYIGGYQDLEDVFVTDMDAGNAVTNYSSVQNTSTDFNVTTHELRFESTGDRRVDYSAGLWYSDTESKTVVHQPAELAGAFGYPAVPQGPANPDFLLGVDILIPTDSENTAVFGHLEFHVSDSLDIGVGARYLEEKSQRAQTLATGSAFNAVDMRQYGLTEPLIGTLCNAGLFPAPFATGQSYPNTCNAQVDASTFYQPVDDEWDTWVYDASIKYHLNEDFLLYFTAAHSWRPPGVTVGITTPLPDSVLFGPPEESDAFELGMKSEWLDRRLRLNAALFYQEFDGFIGRFEDVPYDSGPAGVGTGGFTYNGDATTYGGEADLLFLVNENWTAQLTMSMQKGEYDDASVPCRDTDFDGQPDNGPNPPVWGGAGPVAFCTSSDPISNLPDWSATLQSEYVIPADSLEYYLRGLLNYQPENDNFTTGFERESLALLNLYAGVRSADGRWDVTLWTKNALDEGTVLQLDSEAQLAGFRSGYRGISVQPEREIGLSVSYAFGAH